MIPTEIIPVTELTDTELDAVSGGLLNNLNIAPQLNIALPNVTPQINIGVPTGVAVGLGTAATILQNLGQGNVG